MINVLNVILNKIMILGLQKTKTKTKTKTKYAHFQKLVTYLNVIN